VNPSGAPAGGQISETPAIGEGDTTQIPSVITPPGQIVSEDQSLIPLSSVEDIKTFLSQKYRKVDFVCRTFLQAGGSAFNDHAPPTNSMKFNLLKDYTPGKVWSLTSTSGALTTNLSAQLVDLRVRKVLTYTRGTRIITVTDAPVLNVYATISNKLSSYSDKPRLITAEFFKGFETLLQNTVALGGQTHYAKISCQLFTERIEE